MVIAIITAITAATIVTVDTAYTAFGVCNDVGVVVSFDEVVGKAEGECD